MAFISSVVAYFSELSRWLCYPLISKFDFYEFLWEAKQSAIFHARVIARRKAWFCLCMSRILFAAKHSWMTLLMSGPLFVGSYLHSRGGLSANEKKEKFASNDNCHS